MRKLVILAVIASIVTGCCWDIDEWYTKYNSDLNKNVQGKQDEILRLENGGMTVKKAISAMMHGTYAARMRDVKPETWRRYFNDWRRHRVMDVKASVDKNHTTVEKSVDNFPHSIITYNVIKIKRF